MTSLVVSACHRKSPATVDDDDADYTAMNDSHQQMRKYTRHNAPTHTGIMLFFDEQSHYVPGHSHSLFIASMSTIAEASAHHSGTTQ